MDASRTVLVTLQVFHALAAVVWLGGGIYFVIAVRPVGNQELSRAARQNFADWAQAATIVLVASGVVLLFDGLSSGKGGLTYAALLCLKVVAAVIAFWAVGFRRRDRPRTTPEVILALGLFTFTVGVVLSLIWPS